MGKMIATYDYKDKNNRLVYQVCRFEPKDFRVRRPTKENGWTWSIKSVKRVLYRLPELISADLGTPVFVLEGEKDADRAVTDFGLVATTNHGGAGKWRVEYTDTLQNRHVILIPDNDAPGRRHTEDVASKLSGIAASVKIITLPNLPPKGDFSDWVDNGGTREELFHLVESTFIYVPSSTAKSQPVTPISFEEVEATFDRWLLIADRGYLRVVTGAVIANLLEGDPFWLFIVAPSGGTKTEPIRSLSDLPYIYTLSDLTEQTFLSGDKGNPNASLLYQLGDFAILVMKDFTTVLSMRHEKRAVILAQLREIFDGYYSKPFGTGERKEWKGKIGFVAGVTPAVDQYHSVYSSLGERFLQYRPVMPKRRDVAKRAMEMDGKETRMRDELREAVGRYIMGLSISESVPQLPPHLSERLAALSDLCARARSGILREGYHTRDIELAPDPELPTRIAKQLKKVTVAFAVMSGGDFREDDYALTWKIGMDSIPKHRREILFFLEQQKGKVRTAATATALGIPTKTNHRTLEDLNALGLLERSKDGTAANAADLWELTQETRLLLKEARGHESSPNFSGLRESEKFAPHSDTPVNAPQITSSPASRPTTPCFTCKQDAWWQREDGGWVCGVCYPSPKENSPTSDDSTVTIDSVFPGTFSG